MRLKIVLIQAHSRGFLLRARYQEALQELKNTREKLWARLSILITYLQANCRGYLLRRECNSKMNQLREERNTRKVLFEKMIIRVQANCRGCLLRKQHGHKLQEMKQERQKHQKLPLSTGFNSSAYSANVCDTPKSATKSDSPNMTKPAVFNTAKFDVSNTIVKSHSTKSDSSKTKPAASNTTTKSDIYSNNASDTAKPDTKFDSSNNMSKSAASNATKSGVSNTRYAACSTTNFNSTKPNVSNSKFAASNTTKPASCHGPNEHCKEVYSIAGEEENTVSEDMVSLIAEQKALQDLVRCREEEQAVAQLARERMASIFTAAEIASIAEKERRRESYGREIAHTSSPLLPTAWLGVIEERLTLWKATHSPCPVRPTARPHPPLGGGTLSHPEQPTAQGLTKAQLLAASPKGTQLEQVLEVVVYKSRQPVALNSLEQCPQVRTITLTKCGVETLVGLEKRCPHLMQINMCSNGMKQVALGQQHQLCFLDLSDNHLTSLHSLGYTPGLLEMNLSGNRIARVTGVNGCPQLCQLTLDTNLLINLKVSQQSVRFLLSW